MITIVVIATWLFFGWLGWRVVLSWWTQDLDMTRQDRTMMRGLLIIGPLYLLIALSLLVVDRRQRKDEIIYPRKAQS